MPEWCPQHRAPFQNGPLWGRVLSNLTVGGDYWLFGWRDSDMDGLLDPTEARESFPANSVHLSGDTTNVAIVLNDPDSNLNAVPDWWEIKYGLDLDTFDDLLVPAGQTVQSDSVAANVVGTNAAGSSVLRVSSTNGLRNQDLVLVICMQDPTVNLNENRAGLYESCRVTGVGPSHLTLRQPLSHEYIGEQGIRVQVVKIAEFDTVVVNGLLTCRAWDGAQGGILALVARHVILGSQGRISADGKGYRGGGVAPRQDPWRGMAGEGTQRHPTSMAGDTSENLQGGGGASRDSGNGGGGEDMAVPEDTAL